MSINIKHIDNIKYTGSVTVLYQGKDGKYRTLRKKNDAFMPMFTFLTQALQGNLFHELKPKYLFGYYQKKIMVDGKHVIVDAFTNKLAASSAGTRYVYESTSGAKDPNSKYSNCIQYSFVIPTSCILSRPGSDNDYDKDGIHTLVLKNSLSSDEDSICASIDVSDYNINSNATSNIIIYWRITLGEANGTKASDVFLFDGQNDPTPATPTPDTLPSE